LKNVIITGATKGIGRAVAHAFAAAGCNLAICARNESDLSLFREELQEVFPAIRVVYQPCDVSDATQVRAFAEMVKREMSVVDVLVNNAGIFLPGSVSEEADGVFEKLFFTNVASAYHLTRAILPAMNKSVKPHIFNMCSIASITAYANGGSYTISKFAMLGFSKVLREELKSTNIKVTSILPGPTWSDSWQGTVLPKERFTDPNDVAATILNAYHLGDNAVIEELIIRPQLGDI
jgi:short-subunit dehydrogenase